MKKEELIIQVGFLEEDLLSKKKISGLKEARMMYHAGLVEKCDYTLAMAAETANRSERTISRSIRDSNKVPSILDLAEGITSEVMIPEFTTVRQPEKIFRMDNNGRRYYYKFENEEPVFLTSMTSLIDSTLPMSPQVFKWAIDKFGSYDEYRAWMKLKAAYGTFLHLETARLLMKQKYMINDMKEYLQLYIEEHKLDHTFMSHLTELKKDLIAFAKFAIDRKIKVIAIEIVLSSSDGYGGALDIVLEMYVGKTYVSGAKAGLPKEDESIREEVILDIKSGRKGFFESHEIQLGGYRNMWNEHFPDKQINKLYNWAPAEWRDVPKYKLKDQTDSKNLRKLPLLIELNKINEENKTLTATTIGGKINLNDGSYGTINVRELRDVVMDSK